MMPDEQPQPKPPVRPSNPRVTVHSPLKSILTFLGALFLLIIGLGCCTLGYTAYLGGALAPSSKAYVDESVPAIIKTWSKDELVARASPELRQATSKEQLDKVFAQLEKLGAFQSYGAAKGNVNINLSGKGFIVTASYAVNASFSRGKVAIKIKLIRRDLAWQILGFHVDPAPLVE